MEVYIKVPIFNAKIRIVWDMTDEEFLKWLKKRKLEGLEVSRFENSEGITYRNGFYIVIRFVTSPENNPGLVFHELFHAVQGILMHAGLKLVDESEEIYAWLIDYVASEFYKKSNLL